MKKSTILFLFLFLGVLGCFGQTQSQTEKVKAQNQAKPSKVEWVPSTINGITLGKSKYDDILRLWGKPIMEHEFVSQDEELENPDLETELVYRNVEIDGLMPSIGVLINDRTRLVTSISLFFVEMTKDEAIQKYGSDYYLVSSIDSTCISKSQERTKEVGILNYPISLVYPQMGMTIAVRDDNMIMMVSFTEKC